MRKIAVVTDTTCDLPPEMLKDYNIVLASMKVHFGEEEYTDQVTMDHAQFYQKMVENPDILPRTTQPQTKDFLEIYRRLGKEGYSTIFSLHISSKMSGTIQAANVAAGMLEEMDIIPIDTGQVGPALGVFIYLVAEKMKQGPDKEELKAFVEKLVQQSDAILEIFTVNTMEYLVKNGRVGKAKGFAAGLLNIKPILTLKNGEITPLDKVRGKKALLEKISRLALDRIKKCRKPVLSLSWGDESMEENVEAIYKKIENEYGKSLQVIRCRISPTVGCHAGPEVFSLAVADMSFC